jgi:hypothetical protein
MRPVLEIQAIRRALVAMVLMVACQVEASPLQLRWDPSSSQVSGYRLHYGRSSGQYEVIVDVGNQTSYPLTDLDAGERYYFTVTAYDDEGNESDFGDEVTLMPSSPESMMSSEMISDPVGWEGIHGLQMDDERHNLARSHGDIPSSLQEEYSDDPGTAARSNSDSFQGSVVPPLVSAHIEIGVVPIDQEWKRVELRKPFVNPVMIVKEASSQQADPVVVQVRHMGDSSFVVRLQPGDNHERVHTPVTVSYMVIERGRFTLESGIVVEAGIVESETIEDLARINFRERFSMVPVVLTTVINNRETEQVSGRPTMISKGEFRYRSQALSHQQSTDRPLRLAYVAWEPSGGVIDELTFEVDRERLMTHNLPQTLTFGIAFKDTPVFVSDTQEPMAKGTLGVRVDEISPERAIVMSDADPASAADTDLKAPVVGYIAIMGPFGD